ncbi:MAG: hypothetical protein GC160_04570 [Acidobacteria bacterium]|nr:hypothetical protein [Acidobacteriota bacterium]
MVNKTMLLKKLFYFALSLTIWGTPSQGAPSTPSHASGVVSDSDWSEILRLRRQRAFAVTAAGEGFQARNPGQQWLVRLDRRGFGVQPEQGGWSWGLDLAAYGVGDAELKVEGKAPRVDAESGRLSYGWSETLEEWYVNDARGLEHGFTLFQRPQGDGDRVKLWLSVRGGLRGQTDADGAGVGFVDGSGKAVVRYDGLKAWDADGRVLPSRITVTADNGLLLTVDDREARYPLTVDPLAQQAYLKASNTEADDAFGHAVAASGDTVVVGAPYEDGNGTGVNPNTQADNSITDCGAVYVFVKSNGVWTQEAYIKASNPDHSNGYGDWFGLTVAISGDTLIVGAPNESSNGTGVNPNTQSDNSAAFSGAAYVFVRDNGVWSQQAYLKASNTGANDAFGTSVAISGDTAVVGAYWEGSSGTGVNPNTQSDNGAGFSGAAYVFVRNGSLWSQQAYLKASNTGAGDAFGTSVAISGDTAVIGAPAENGNGIGVNPNTQSDNSAAASGAAYVFVRNGSLWSQQAYLKASNTDIGDVFGGSVAISGDTAVVGASGEDGNGIGVNPNTQADNSAASSGAAYLFVRDSGVWSQQAYLKASNTGAGDEFGGNVAISGDTAAVGASGEGGSGTGVNPNTQSDNNAAFSGAAYLFVRNGGAWSQQAYLKASNTDPSDFFGGAVALSSSALVAGARQEGSSGTGVNPNAQGDNTASRSGAAYIFGLGGAPDNVGVYRNGEWLLDVNGNGVFDSGVDFDFFLGFEGATPVTGDWNGDGHETAGVYAGGFWFLDYDGDGVFNPSPGPDKQYAFGFAGALPVVGDWNGDGRDSVGVHANGYWFLDYDGNETWDGGTADKMFGFGGFANVQIMIGDWNGDGRDKMGLYANGYWFLDYDGDYSWDGGIVDKVFGFGWTGATPLVGDWDGDGRDSVAVYSNGAWFLDYDGDTLWNPGANDRILELGWTGAVTVIGDWNGDGRDKAGVFSGGNWFLDYDGSATWDGGLDKLISWGETGDVPFVGAW